MLPYIYERLILNNDNNVFHKLLPLILIALVYSVVCFENSVIWFITGVENLSIWIGHT